MDLIIYLPEVIVGLLVFAITVVFAVCIAEANDRTDGRDDEQDSLTDADRQHKNARR